MKIELLDKNKLKIMFDYTELEENDISIHSFLSNSNKAQNFFLAIIDIANEDLGFNSGNSNLSYETISFDNKFFVIIVTKDASNELSKFDVINNSFDKNQNVEFLYKLRDINELFSFCDALKLILPTLNFCNSLYQYEDSYFLKINLENLDKNLRNRILLLISEFKTELNLSELSLTKFEEFADTIIENNAIQIL